MSDSLRPRGLCSPWDSPGQNTGVGSLSLLQGIFPTQESNPGLPCCRRILYKLSHKGSPASDPRKVLNFPNFFLEFHLPQTTRARLAERRRSEEKQFSSGADVNLSKERPHQAAPPELRRALPRLGEQVPTQLKGWKSVLTLDENRRQQSPALI